MTLKDKVFDLLESEIRDLEKRLSDRKGMLELLKSYNPDDVARMIGIISWYYKEKTKSPNTKPYTNV